ncbi:MAG: monosaccharide-P-dolichol utilization protein [Linnemannia gamsii]|nr:MAG: monosaccharide-P-dolichol utilization protein [Linnemannia gamsii]
MQLPYFLKTPAVAIIGDACYTSLIEEFNYHNALCIKLAISKGLGYGIVAGGAIVKMPQIFKISSTRSVQGLSLSSYLLETLACIIGLAYNIRHGHSLSTYGETFFVAIQDLIILGLMLHYTGKNIRAFIILSSFLLLGSILGITTRSVQDDGSVVTSFIVSESALAFLQEYAILIILFSKIPQIIENYKNKNTGQLSAFAVFNYFAGSLARVYTTLTEVKDVIILYGFLLSTFLNCVLALQMTLYWNSNGVQPLKSKNTNSPTTSETNKRLKKLD